MNISKLKKFGMVYLIGIFLFIGIPSVTFAAPKPCTTGPESHPSPPPAWHTPQPCVTPLDWEIIPTPADNPFDFKEAGGPDAGYWYWNFKNYGGPTYQCFKSGQWTTLNPSGTDFSTYNCQAIPTNNRFWGQLNYILEGSQDWDSEPYKWFKTQ